jgi:hypothetical protein
MKFSVDPWDPSYGTSVEGELERSTVEVAVDVEQPAQMWLPIDPDPALAAPEAVLFVDGVRRTDAQVWVNEPDGSASPALCASYAAGVVCCCRDGGAHLLQPEIRRGLFTTAADGVDVTTSAGGYRCIRVEAKPGADPAQVLSAAVQKDMAEAEVLVSATARDGHAPGHGDAGHDLLVVDGSLNGRQHLPRALGFVKTHSRGFLPSEVGGIVAELRAGQRTPVFRMGRPGADSLIARYSWYLRLPCAPGAPWAGIARIECSAELPVSQAVVLADTSQVTLPRFASTEYKDSRAPQNLYPIAGLERALRRRLGEPTLLYRALRRAASA